MKILVILLAITMAKAAFGEMPEPSPTPSVTPTPAAYGSAVIRYVIEGERCRGTETLYVKGDRRRIERNVAGEFMGRENVDKSVSIEDGDNLHYINLTTGSGTRQVNPFKDAPSQEREGLLYGIPCGREELLGRQCTVYQLLGQRTWIWEGLPLKVETDIAVKSATSIDIDAPVADSLFELPPDVSITHIPQ